MLPIAIGLGAVLAFSSLDATSAQTALPSSVVSDRVPLSPPSYTLGGGDIVQINVFRLPEYSGEHQIQVDGSLNLPLVGRVNLGGLTVDSAADTLSMAYSRVLRRPLVSVSLLRRRPASIGIAGEVIQPGSYVLSPEGASIPTLTQLLETAGGVTQSANLRQVQIRRQSGEVLTVNLWQLLETGDIQKNVALLDGDSVFIPPTQVPLAEGTLLANASFSADASRPIEIAVVGEVFRPGPYTVTGGVTQSRNAGTPGNSTESPIGNATVTDAIRLAGGIKPLANIRQVQVKRVNHLGSEQVFDVDLWAMLQTGDLTQDAILQDRDTVIVPTASGDLDPAEVNQIAVASFAPDTISVNVVGEVTRSGIVQVPPNTTLNQAILAAGGFNERARTSSVALVRLNPDGTVTQRKVDIDFTQGIDDAGNPIVRNNDVIIVNESALASVGDTLGAVARPLANVFSLFAAPIRLLNLFD